MEEQNLFDPRCACRKVPGELKIRRCSDHPVTGRGKDHPAFDERGVPLVRECLRCSKQFMVMMGQVEGRLHREFCSRRCGLLTYPAPKKVKKIRVRVGYRFGRLMVLECPDTTRSDFSIKFRCRCDCGIEKWVAGLALLSPRPTLSCGCLAVEIARTPKTHGMTYSLEHNSWGSMKSRCNNPNDPGYKHYGGRGIKVCDRWMHSFGNFYADVGPRPGGKHEYSLERIDVNGDYQPGNVRWATALEQARNKRTNCFVEIDGKRLVITDAAISLGISVNVLRRRISKGLPL